MQKKIAKLGPGSVSETEHCGFRKVVSGKRGALHVPKLCKEGKKGEKKGYDFSKGNNDHHLANRGREYN